jgi:hypothetical protein
MLGHGALRQALTAFLGSDRYRKFFRQGMRRSCIRFCQTQEWDRFVSAHPEFDALRGWADFKKLVVEVEAKAEKQ